MVGHICPILCCEGSNMSFLHYTENFSGFIILHGNRGDKQKTHVTRQFFKASGPQGHFFEKTKKKRF